MASSRFLASLRWKGPKAPQVYKHKLLFQSYWDGAGAKPLKYLDYREIKQLVADEGKDEVYGCHFLSTLAAKNAA
jgi:hypothetical protein